MNYNLKEVENIAWAAWYTASFQLSENTTEEDFKEWFTRYIKSEYKDEF